MSFFIQKADPQLGMFSSVSEVTGQEIEERRLRGMDLRKALEWMALSLNVVILWACYAFMTSWIFGSFKNFSRRSGFPTWLAMYSINS